MAEHPFYVLQQERSGLPIQKYTDNFLEHLTTLVLQTFTQAGDAEGLTGKASN